MKYVEYPYNHKILLDCSGYNNVNEILSYLYRVTNLLDNIATSNTDIQSFLVSLKTYVDEQIAYFSDEENSLSQNCSGQT